MPKVNQLNMIHPHNCATLNAVREQHSEWCWFYNRGYIQYCAPDWKTKIYEHKLVAEFATGTRLGSKLHVHHKNRDKSDNRADNLQVVTEEEHDFIHHGQRSMMVKCDVCNKSFERKNSHLNRNKHNFCSQQCMAMGYRKVKNRPTKDELAQLIENNSFLAIGRMFGVTDQAIRKWAKQYELI